MESEVTLTVPPIIAIAILTAIPVVAHALWSEYFKASIAERLELPGGRDRDEDQDEELDPSFELRRVRWTAIFALLVQVAVHLSIAPLRALAPLSSLLLFFGALIAQSRISLSSEQALRLPGTSSKDQFQVILRAMLWTIGSLFFYFGLVWGSLFTAHAILSQMTLPREVAVWSLAACGIAAVFLATGLLLGLAPLHLRKMLPCSRLDDEKLRKKLDETFFGAGQPPPEYFVLESEEFRFTNAMISGFSRGRGPFRPALFLSRTLLSRFTHPELEAIALHEVSHWALKHVRRRFVYSLVTIVVSTLALGVVFVVGQLVLDAPSLALLRLITSVASILIPLGLIRGQTAQHELEADLFCVLRLGADFESFASALRKLDRLNDLDSSNSDPASMLNPGGGHPSTELRILRVRQALLKAHPKAEPRSAAAASESTDINRAA